jgi:hypothetical protein
MYKPLRILVVVLLSPIWVPIWLMVMGVGVTMGQPMTWVALVMHFKYRYRAPTDRRDEP